MAEATEVYFTPEGLPTLRMIQLARGKGALQALHPRMQLHQDGKATLILRGWWNKAFPTRQAIPPAPVATKDGRMTPAMLGIWLD